MGLIQIGTFTPKHNPSGMTIIRPEVFNSTELTYEDVVVFSWGPSIIGKQIQISWNIMDGDDFAALDLVYQADEQVVFNPNDNSGKTYNVKLLKYDGDYFFGGRNDDSDSKRNNVKLVIVIISIVV